MNSKNSPFVPVISSKNSRKPSSTSPDYVNKNTNNNQNNATPKTGFINNSNLIKQPITPIVKEDNKNEENNINVNNNSIRNNNSLYLFENDISPFNNYNYQNYNTNFLQYNNNGLLSFSSVI